MALPVWESVVTATILMTIVFLALTGLYLAVRAFSALILVIEKKK